MPWYWVPVNICVVVHICVVIYLLKMPYPSVRRADYITYFHGKEIPDPYHWLEDLESNETLDFVERQSNFTEEFFSKIPERKDIEKAYTNYSSYDTFNLPVYKGGRYFYSEDAGEHLEILYTKKRLEDEPEIAFDPNNITDHEDYTLGEMTPSEDGTVLAYFLSKFGSDWQTIHFRNLKSNEDLPEVLEDTKGPDVAWTHDSAGVFYARYPLEDGEPTSMNNKLYYHYLGTEQSEDILILEFPEQPRWSMTPTVSDDGKYLIVDVAENTKGNGMYVAKLNNPKIDEEFNKSLVPIFPNVKDALYHFIGNSDSQFFIQTNKDTNNGRLMTFDFENAIQMYKADPHRTPELKELIPEDPNKVLEWVFALPKDLFLLGYINDVQIEIQVTSRANVSRRAFVSIPEQGLVKEAYAHQGSDELLVKFQSYVNPGTIYRCDLRTYPSNLTCSIYMESELKTTDASMFVVDQKFFRSKDGTKVPMHIIRKKNANLNGRLPTIITGYGGFGESILPEFDITKLFFVEKFNGIYAIVNARGGGEYGKRWTEEGSRLKKQNTFDDFIAAAEYLIWSGYTNSRKLAISGSSNGGMIVGAVINQRPDLFGAGIAQVGVLDMLRFQNFTEGYAWCEDYGCSEDKTDFENLVRYSPLHNIKMPRDKRFQYPAMLVTTGKHDDRVVPSHSYKYIAELQHTIGGEHLQTNPLLLRVSGEHGHTENSVELETDIFAFGVRTLGWEFKDDKLEPKPYADSNLMPMKMKYQLNKILNEDHETHCEYRRTEIPRYSIWGYSKYASQRKIYTCTYTSRHQAYHLFLLPHGYSFHYYPNYFSHRWEPTIYLDNNDFHHLY